VRAWCGPFFILAFIASDSGASAVEGGLLSADARPSPTTGLASSFTLIPTEGPLSLEALPSNPCSFNQRLEGHITAKRLE
jgi:hypothetical protein